MIVSRLATCWRSSLFGFPLVSFEKLLILVCLNHGWPDVIPLIMFTFRITAQEGEQ